ncbi:MAG TPA: paraquat-inducible protein A [Planctomycetota bacterium]|nr:paraquat-inducible protein A [Planctomycetota bacterium]
MSPAEIDRLSACRTCGLIQRRPAHRAGWRAHCHRCAARLPDPPGGKAMGDRTAAAAMAALILYPVAVGLPIVRVERLGVVHEANTWEAVTAMISSGDVVVGVAVAVCSIVLPLVKLLALLDLSLRARRHAPLMRARIAHIIEWCGRWSMIDVLLAAMLVAVVKLGNLMTVSPGPGALAFTLMVFLSLVASASFDPRSLWHDQPSEKPHA